MTAPVFNILTTKELTIDLSRPAILFLLAKLGYTPHPGPLVEAQAEGEIENFRNMLLNLLERSAPIVDNSDLVS